MSPWSGKSLETFEHDRPLFEHFLDVVPDAMLGVESGTGRIIFVNAEAEKLFRATHDELIGLQIEELIPPRFRGGHSAHRAGYFAAPKTRPMGAGMVLYGLRTDGTEFPAEISLSNFKIGDQTVASAAVRDITERVRAEAENKRLQDELASNQSLRLESVGALAGGIAHDFNNLLGVIMNYAELAGDAVSDLEVKEDIEQIQESAARAATLTRQLLIFSRREVVKPRALALNAVVSDLEKLMRRTIGEQIELRSTYADDLWTIVADPGQLEQIVVNLAVNARDAMPHGGLLEIDTQNVVLDDEYARTQSDGPAPGKYVRITIADSGDGMPPDVLERAFEPFFSTKPQGEGTGLGLATVYGIVKQAGGNVFIYSEPGHGTSVKIHLPASDATVEQWVTAHAPVLAPSGGEAILVVEDEDVVRRLVERILAEKGYAVLAMPSAAKALAELSEGTRHFDLLLTDVVMPGMQGSELAHHAREIQPGLPVLLMSGYSEAIIERIDGRQGALDLVEKPFTRAQLLGAVSKSLSGAPQREVVS
jgi:hypothetical protein